MKKLFYLLSISGMLAACNSGTDATITPHPPTNVYTYSAMESTVAIECSNLNDPVRSIDIDGSIGLSNLSPAAYIYLDGLPESTTIIVQGGNYNLATEASGSALMYFNYSFPNIHEPLEVSVKLAGSNGFMESPIFTFIVQPCNN